MGSKSNGIVDRLWRTEFAAKVVRRVPAEVREIVPGPLKRILLPAPEHPLPSLNYLSKLQRDNYQVDSLVGVSPDEFKRQIEAFSSIDDADMEGYSTSGIQRGRSVRFEWSEDQDFGTFKVTGMSTNRAIWLLATFMDDLSALPKTLVGKRVLDIGCWTGATSFLLAAMGASVVAVEEVRKYVDCVKYLRDAFGISDLEPRNLSLYDLTDDEFQDAFDIVLFGGVLYHLSDPVLGMRITFNTLRPQGICLVESAVARSKKRICEYAGKDEAGRGTSANWFYPSPPVLEAMMDEVGYRAVHSQVRVQPSMPTDRMTAVGTKVAQVDMLRAGLSVPGIR